MSLQNSTELYIVCRSIPFKFYPLYFILFLFLFFLSPIKNYARNYIIYERPVLGI